jgi:hypothetical protein
MLNLNFDAHCFKQEKKFKRSKGVERVPTFITIQIAARKHKVLGGKIAEKCIYDCKLRKFAAPRIVTFRSYLSYLYHFVVVV